MEEKKIVEITIDDELKPLSKPQSFMISEFYQYKVDTLSDNKNNFITPNEFHQASYPSAHNLFGRDRVFDYPKSELTRIDFENIAHVHYNIDDAWKVSDKQWSCTSDSSVVYSGFILKGTYHLIIHELLTEDAHQNYTEDDVDYYLDNAEYHRETITTNSEK